MSAFHPLHDGRLAKRIVVAPSSCWIWAGPLKNGYGIVGLGKRAEWGYAHRFLYERVNGPIPAGLQIDHLCRNRPCVNPSHLEAVTPAENQRRAGAVKTHCPQGHAYSEENTYRLRFQRRCRACKRNRERGVKRIRRRNRAEATA